MTPTSRLGCWPTAAQEALLRAALVDGAAAVDAWVTWQRLTATGRLDEGSLRLIPLLHRTLPRLGVSSPRLAEFAAVHRRSWFANQILFHEVAGVLAACRDGGIQTLLLKGVPLAIGAYPDEASRPMGDADLLVRPVDLVRAVALLRQRGWRPVPEPVAFPAEPRNAWTFANAAGREIDLHWRVFRAGCHADDDLWAAAVPLEVRGVETRALCPSDALLHVIAHGVVWNPVPSIRWAADAALIIRAAGPALEWNQLVSRAEARDLVPTLSLGLAYLASRLDVVVPASVIARLEARPLTRRERLIRWSEMQPGVVSGAARVWFDYVRYEGGLGHRPGPVRFVNYLKAFWQIDPGRGVLSMAADRIRHRVRELRQSTGR